MNVSETVPARRVFMILSPRALPYARHGIKSLLTNALEPLHLHLITDTSSDKDRLTEELASYALSGRHHCEVLSKTELDDHESRMFGPYPNLRLFRAGHPCWRKICDPLLLSGEGDEMVLLDPDLYFPNRFTFESTPARGLLLMWQPPSCLLPFAIVDAAMRSCIPLAHHVDIGVAHWRAQLDLEWLEWLLSKLRIADHPNARGSMHIEAIVWAAIAMRVGGGYLPREHWHCWRNSQRVRLLRRLGIQGPQLLQSEPFATIKCFHAGGEAKYWLDEAFRRAWPKSGKPLDQPGLVLPFVQLTPRAYQRGRAVKTWLKRFGYYNFFPSGVLQ